MVHTGEVEAEYISVEVEADAWAEAVDISVGEEAVYTFPWDVRWELSDRDQESYLEYSLQCDINRTRIRMRGCTVPVTLVGSSDRGITRTCRCFPSFGTPSDSAPYVAFLRCIGARPAVYRSVRHTR